MQTAIGVDLGASHVAAAVVTDIVRHDQPEARARAWLAAAERAPAEAARAELMRCPT